MDLNKKPVNDRMTLQKMAAQKALKQRQQSELKKAESNLQISEGEFQRMHREEVRIQTELAHLKPQIESYEKRLGVSKGSTKVLEEEIIKLKSKIQTLKNDLSK